MARDLVFLRRWTRVMALVLFVVIGVVGGVRRAEAHASLLSSDPVDGAMLSAAPASVSLTFNEPVDPIILKLIRPSGAATVLTVPAAGTTLTAPLPKDLADGTHAISWRVISADGHPVGGTIVFSIRVLSGGSVVAQAPDTTRAVTIWVARALMLAGLLFGIGGAICDGLLKPVSPRAKPAIMGVALVGSVAAVLSIGLQGLDVLDIGLSEVGSTVAWKTGWQTTFGYTASILASAGLFAAITLFLPFRWARAIAAALLVVSVGAAAIASGHAATALPAWAMRPAVFVHVVAAVLWIGALVPLVASTDKALLQRFSAIAPVIVAVLILSGTAIAVVQVEHIRNLIATNYGRLLLAKLGLVAILLVIAAINRWRFTRPVISGDVVAGKRLKQLIWLEILVSILVIAVVAGWRFTPPPRVLDAIARAPVHFHIHTLPAMADVTITPGHAGPVSVSVMTMTGEFMPLEPKEIEIELANPQAGIEPIRRMLEKRKDGLWHLDGLVIPIGGRWTVKLDLLVTDFDMLHLSDEVTLR